MTHAHRMAALEIAELQEQLQNWKKMFCVLARMQGGEIRVSLRALQALQNAGAKTTFETFVDAETQDRVFKVIEEESTPCSL